MSDKCLGLLSYQLHSKTGVKILVSHYICNPMLKYLISIPSIIAFAFLVDFLYVIMCTYLQQGEDTLSQPPQIVARLKALKLKAFNSFALQSVLTR